jgi:hypothetical protein
MREEESSWTGSDDPDLCTPPDGHGGTIHYHIEYPTQTKA